jgi:hypothetical protein
MNFERNPVSNPAYTSNQYPPNIGTQQNLFPNQNYQQHQQQPYQPEPAPKKGRGLFGFMLALFGLIIGFVAGYFFSQFKAKLANTAQRLKPTVPLTPVMPARQPDKTIEEQHVEFREKSLESISLFPEKKPIGFEFDYSEED